MTPSQDLVESRPTKEALDLARIKAFCARILKTLAPPLLLEIERSTSLSLETTNITPRRVTRSSASAMVGGRDKPLKKASAAEAVLLKTLGITPAELSVTDEDFLTFR
jgi:hypothetical protein